MPLFLTFFVIAMLGIAFGLMAASHFGRLARIRTITRRGPRSQGCLSVRPTPSTRYGESFQEEELK